MENANDLSEADAKSDVATYKCTVEDIDDDPVDLPKLVQRPIANIMSYPDNLDAAHEEEEENDDIRFEKLNGKTRVKVPYTPPADSEMHVEVNTTTPGCVAAEASGARKNRFKIKTPWCFKTVSIGFHKLHS